MKVLTFLTTFGINLAAAFVLFFFLILSLNGYHEKDANWGIYLYVALATLSALLTAAASVFAVGYLVTKKQMSGFIAALISIAIFVVVGMVLNLVSIFFGIIMAEIKRVNF